MFLWGIFGEFFMVKKNKKGMLLASEVVKLVIALIGISLLVYLLVSIYYNNARDKNLNDAKATISRIKDIIARIDAGTIQSEKVTDITPSSWSFFSYIGNEKKPNSCAGENCLCICDTVSFDNFLFFKDRQISECDTNGVCIPVKNLNKFSSFKIKKPKDGGTSVEILSVSGNIGVKEE